MKERLSKKFFVLMMSVFVLTALCFTLVTLPPVRQVSGAVIQIRTYEELSNAFANANSGDTVKLTTIIYYRDEGSVEAKTIKVTKNIELDLNGHRISLYKNISAFEIMAGGHLTIKDTTAEGKGYIESSYHQPIIALPANGTLDVIKGRLLSEPFAVIISNYGGGTVNISGTAKIESRSSSSPAISNTNGILNISGGEITANTNVGISNRTSTQNASASICNITGGVINASGRGSAVENTSDDLNKKSQLNISGGQVIASGTSNIAVTNGLYSVASVTGGTITSNVGGKAFDNQQGDELSFSGSPVVTGNVVTHDALTGTGYTGGTINIVYDNTALENSIVVKGTTDLTKFQLVSTSYRLGVDNVNGNLIMQPLEALPTINAIASAVYKGVKQTPVVTITGLTEGQDYTLSWDDASCKNAKTYTVTATGKGNYGGTQTQTFTITKAELTIKAKNATTQQGAAADNNGVEISGFVGTDTINDLSGTLSYTYNYNPATDKAGKYSITPSGLTSDNYNITFVGGELTVTPSGGTGGGSKVSGGAIAGIIISIILGLFFILIALYILWKESVLKGKIFHVLLRPIDPIAVKVCKVFCKQQRLFTVKGTKQEQKEQAQINK